MAAWNYYNPTPNHTTNPYHDDPSRQERGAVSPVTSPFDDDHTHPFARQHSDTSYLNPRSHGDSDPFDDGNAIPLSGRKSAAASTQTIAPMLPPEDPFVRDIDPRKRREQEKRQGWFHGQITWVVYILTVVQLIVFIVEIVRNGKLTHKVVRSRASLTDYKRC
jgi:hypothetical protein